MKLIRSDRKALFAFMAPALIVMLLFFVIPVLYVIVVSFLKWNGISAPVFNNLKNYALLTKDKSFSRSVINNIIWAVVAGFIQVPLAMVMAIILSRKPKGWKFFRTVYFFPQVISGIALATLWRAIYNAEHGMLNGLLSSVGLSSASKDWLGTIQTAFPAVLIYWVFYIGYYMVIMMADITTIDTSYYEAATIDGANDLQIFVKVYLPMSLPMLATIGLFFAVGNWNSWYNAMLFIKNPDYMPLQYVLRELIVEGSSNMERVTEAATITEGFKMASVFFTIVPMMCFYPFLQKFFVKGLVVGAIKG